jgi:hypothetical protein
MGFKSGAEWNGNSKGRVPKKTRENIGKDELELILRRLKPLSRVALTKLGVILEDGSETTKLKAITLILSEYKDLVEELYINSDDDSESEDIKPAVVTPLISLVRKEEDR